MALRDKEMKLVIMNESKVYSAVRMVRKAMEGRWLTPAPATPASVCTEFGTKEQFPGLSNIVHGGVDHQHVSRGERVQAV